MCFLGVFRKFQIPKGDTNLMVQVVIFIIFRCSRYSFLLFHFIFTIHIESGNLLRVNK